MNGGHEGGGGRPHLLPACRKQCLALTHFPAVSLCCAHHSPSPARQAWASGAAAACDSEPSPQLRLRSLQTCTPRWKAEQQEGPEGKWTSRTDETGDPLSSLYTLTVSSKEHRQPRIGPPCPPEPINSRTRAGPLAPVPGLVWMLGFGTYQASFLACWGCGAHQSQESWPSDLYSVSSRTRTTRGFDPGCVLHPGRAAEQQPRHMRARSPS